MWEGYLWLPSKRLTDRTIFPGLINFLSKLCKVGSQTVNQFIIMKLRFQPSQSIPARWKYLACSERVVQLHLFKWINIQSNRVAIVDKYQTNDCAVHNDYCSHSHKVHEGTVHTLITIALIYIAINKWICTPLNARLSRPGFILPSHLCCKAVEMIITLNKAHARIRRQNAATMAVYLQMCLCVCMERAHGGTGHKQREPKRDR